MMKVVNLQNDTVSFLFAICHLTVKKKIKMISFFTAFCLSETKYDYNNETFKLTITAESYNDTIDRLFVAKFQDVTSISVEGPFKTIPDAAFYQSSIKEVSLSDSIEKIGDQSFYECKELLTVSLPRSCIYVGKEAFQGCTKLTSVLYFTNSITLGNEAFYDCDALVSFKLGENSTILGQENSCKLGESCFSGCENLVDIEIPSNTVEFGEKCFSELTSIKKIVIPSVITHIPDSCFMNCGNLTDVNLENVTHIGEYCFYQCKSLTKLQISTKLVSLGSYALYSCSLSEITSLKGSDDLKFGSYCFYGSGLTSFEIPKGMTEIPEYSFALCKKLKTIVLNGKINKIGAFAFHDTAFESFTLPKEVTEIGDGAFSKIQKLKDFKVEEGNNKYEYNDDNFIATKVEPFTIVQYLFVNNRSVLTIPTKYTKIGGGAFISHNEIKDIKLHDDIDEIGISAFERCTALNDAIVMPKKLKTVSAKTFLKCRKLKSVVLQEGVESIGEFCFELCYNLTSVQLPSTLNYIGTMCFSRCFDLKEVAFMSEISLSDSVFYQAGTKKIILFKGAKKIENDSFLESVINTIIYCGTKAIEGSLIDNFNPTVITSSKYESETFMGLNVTKKSDDSCVIQTPMPKTPQSTTTTSSSSSKSTTEPSNSNKRVITIALGITIPIVVVVAVVVIIFIIIRNRRKAFLSETITESLISTV